MAKGLGKGLEGLFEDNFEEISEQKTQNTLRISDIEPNKNQPRHVFDKEALDELAASIAEHGVLQAITVRPIENGRYQIVSGERRWRASRLAGLTEIPVVIRELNDAETLEIGLIENLQREDLNAVEEALGYKELSESFGMTQQEISQRVGKSRPAIANALRLLVLPKPVLDRISSGELSAGHAKALLPLTERLSEKEIVEKVEEIISRGLSVRETENLAKAKRQLKRKGSAKSKEDIYYKEIATELSRLWGRKIEISPNRSKKGSGSICIDFYSADDFEELIKKMK